MQLGSSPLTRGKPFKGSRRGLGGGLIPAHAGKTYLLLGALLVLGAHPRSRGENEWEHNGHTFQVGSSPLTRGKPA